jgi:hypothetical protein
MDFNFQSNPKIKFKNLAVAAISGKKEKIKGL